MGQVLKRYRKLPKSPLFGLITALVVLSMSIVAGLRADANPMPTQTLSGTISTSQTLNPSFVYVVGPDVAIASGATLTIPAGTIVKYESGPIRVRSGGSLRVIGLAANPVHLTSIKDDSVGGDTNGDGSATYPEVGDVWRAVVSENGDTNIVFAKFNYFATVVEANRTSGSIVVTDSIFDNSHNALRIKAPTIKLYRNTFADLKPLSPEGVVQVSGVQDLTKISLSGIDQNKFTGTAKFSRAIQISDVTLPVGKTWTIANSTGIMLNFHGVNTLSGTTNFGAQTTITLDNTVLYTTGVINIYEGVLVKSNFGRIQADQGGELKVMGTSAQPVRFTNLKDDSIGGDTNGDGNTVVPDLGSSNGVIYSGGGSLDIAFATFDYFTEAIYGRAISVTINDSKFSKSWHALAFDGIQELIMQRNEVSVTPDYFKSAIYLSNTADISGMDLSGENKNTFIGNYRARLISLDHAVLPAGKTLDVGSDSGAILNPNGMEVNVDGTLNLGSNTSMLITGNPVASLNVKGSMNVYDGTNLKYLNTQGIVVLEGGSFNAYGSAANPVHFTSIKDDSVGGDTNGDGSATSPALSDYSYAVGLNGGSLYMIHANINYADSAISGNASTLKIFDSSFTNNIVAIDATSPHVKIYRNKFNVLSRGNAAVHLGGVQDISRVSLSGSDQNFFTGNSTASRSIRFHNSKLPVDRSLVVAASSGGSLRFSDGSIDIYGNLTMSPGTLLILDGGRWWSLWTNIHGTLNMQHGSLMKIRDTNGMSIKSGGKVNMTGSSSGKVKITHLYNDGIGGDTNNDGSATSPATSEYNAFTIEEGGTLAASHVDVSYAGVAIGQYGGKSVIDNVNSTNNYNFAYIGGGEASIINTVIQGGNQGINVGRGGHAIFRGSISGQQDFAIRACTWGTQNCSVDAAYVDWGTGGAPATGSVCGQVTVSPWVGGSSSGDGLFTSKNCDNSPTPADQLSSSTQHFGQRMSVRGIDCGNGFEDACEAMRRARTCLSGAVDVAGSTSPFPLPGSEPHEQVTTWGQSLADGATTYIQAIESPTPQLSALQFGSKLLGALNTMVSIGDAYASCAP